VHSVEISCCGQHSHLIFSTTKMRLEAAKLAGKMPTLPKLGHYLPWLGRLITHTYSHIEVNKCYIVDSQKVKGQHRGQQTFPGCYVVYNQELKGQH
jgi:hypothetical protein